MREGVVHHQCGAKACRYNIAGASIAQCAHEEENIEDEELGAYQVDPAELAHAVGGKREDYPRKQRAEAAAALLERQQVSAHAGGNEGKKEGGVVGRDHTVGVR